MVVINFDETNMLMRSKEGQLYLSQVLAAAQEFNKQRKGFIFCIMSGTNVRPLHDLLLASSGGKAPKQIPLPLLKPHHVVQVLKDLFERSSPDEKVDFSQVCKRDLDFVAQVLGGVPRYIELLVYSLGEQKDIRSFAMEAYGTRLKSDTIRPRELLQRVKDLMNIRYSWTFSE